MSGHFSASQNQSGPYTAIWQVPGLGEEKWIQEIFGSILGEWIVDSGRQIVRDHAILFDRHCNAQDPGYYGQFRGKDAFLVDLADENYDFLPEIYANFRGVIRCYWSDIFRTDAVHFLPLGYTHSLQIPDKPLSKATDRQYVWSFLGQLNKSSRPEMARAMTRLEPHLLFATDDLAGLAMWNRDTCGKRRYSQQQNTAIMSDSIFAPCPMGNVNLECYRIYEALTCGTIPIVEKRISLDYFRGLWGDHPIPTVSSWSEAQKFVRHMLKRPAEMDLLQTQCTNWWSLHKQRCIQSLREFIARRSVNSESLHADDIVLSKYAITGWKFSELVRHHDRHALMRRLNKQMSRLLKSGNLRISTSGQSRK